MNSVPSSTVERIQRYLVGLRMPRALEALDATLKRFEQGDNSMLEVLETLLGEEFTTRETRRIRMALQTARLGTIKTPRTRTRSPMRRCYPETISQLADRWTVLVNELNRYKDGRYPDLLYRDVLQFIREVERLVIPDPFEQDILITSRSLVEQGDPKTAMFKVHEVLSGRLSSRAQALRLRVVDWCPTGVLTTNPGKAADRDSVTVRRRRST
ncbi:hypothetical protein AWB78_02962 [Caballeronia calidae]|uniref:Uncharacterized protein n=1 Tax=Caballeronia calidae TaxID=1777139 RepID=A0A158BQ89_9BURK|nr:hypothetical protein AWB78_02962 [Caballeronia calidae]